MIRLIQFFIRKSILGNFITVIILIASIIMLGRMQREQFPSVNYDFVLISTQYTGASTEDVEQFVTIPIEKELTSINGIKNLHQTHLIL